MGQLDEPLDQEGLKQSENLAYQIKEEFKYKFERIYSSPLQRAARTAEIINRDLHLQIDFRPELRERNFGSLAGKTWLEINSLVHVDMHEIDESLQYDYRPFGGESAEEVEHRLKEFVDELVLNRPCNAALVVTHYGIIELMYKITGKERSGLGSESGTGISNDSVHEFVI